MPHPPYLIHGPRPSAELGQLVSMSSGFYLHQNSLSSSIPTGSHYPPRFAPACLLTSLTRALRSPMPHLPYLIHGPRPSAELGQLVSMSSWFYLSQNSLSSSIPTGSQSLSTAPCPRYRFSVVALRATHATPSRTRIQTCPLMQRPSHIDYPTTPFALSPSRTWKPYLDGNWVLPLLKRALL